MEGRLSGIYSLGNIIPIRVESGVATSSSGQPVRMSKPMGCLLAAVLALLALVLTVGIWASLTHPAPKQDQSSSLFPPEILARVTAEQAIKRVMNDPASYQYVSHTVRKVTVAEGVEGYQVEVVFRGRNGFGGLVLNTAAVTTDASGQAVLAVE